jgi:ribosomal protein S18 acetylase RimI-like enzyme
MGAAEPLHLTSVLALDPVRFAPLLEASQREGWRHLERLRDEWDSGANRFEGPGEGLFVAIAPDGAWSALCGLAADPFARKAEIGRLRRLYVMPLTRRRGVGAALVRHVLARAGATFREVRVRTTDASASAFYAALGFEGVGHLEGATHRVVLVR